MSWDHQVHAMRDSERKCPPLSGWECHSEQANKIILFCLGMGQARPAQVNGDDWVADRLVGGLGKTPMLGQKRLRGKIVKTRHGKRYKKGLSHAQWGDTTT